MPSEDSDDKSDDDESMDDNLEDYYAELGIADEKDFLKPEESLYRKKSKKDKTTEEPTMSKKS